MMYRLSLVIGVGLCAALLIGCQNTDSASQAHPTETAISTTAQTVKTNYNKPGFETFEEKGRLWVFRAGSPELAEYLEKGELTKQVIRPNAGPNRMTLKAADAETLDAYLSQH